MELPSKTYIHTDMHWAHSFYFQWPDRRTDCYFVVIIWDIVFSFLFSKVVLNCTHCSQLAKLKWCNTISRQKYNHSQCLEWQYVTHWNDAYLMDFTEIKFFMISHTHVWQWKAFCKQQERFIHLALNHLNVKHQFSVPISQSPQSKSGRKFKKYCFKWILYFSFFPFEQIRTEMMRKHQNLFVSGMDLSHKVFWWREKWQTVKLLSYARRH